MSRQIDGIDRAASHLKRNLKIRRTGSPIEPDAPPITWLIRRRGKIGGPRPINGHPGDRIRTPNGYILVFCPDSPMARAGGYVLEHRLIMAQHIGRPLTDEEVVHHKDQIRHHNRIDNLRLFANNEDHLAHHRDLRRR
jgi:hypothetical protein